MVWMTLHKLSKLFWWTAFCKATSGIEVRHKHLLVWTKYLVRLAHEMDATHYYDVCISLSSLLSKGKTVAYKVCYVLYLTLRIIMRYDNCILFLAHTAYFSFHIDTFWHRFIHKTCCFPLVINHLYIIIYLFIFYNKILYDDDVWLKSS